MVYSYFPMNLDLLYTVSLYFGSDTVPKLIHWGFGVLTALLIYFRVNRRLGPIYGLAGAFFFLTIPIVVRLSISVYVDLGLMFFSTAALFTLLRWAEIGFKLRYAVMAGIWCGLAMGTKYNGFISFLLFFPLMLYLGYSSVKPPNPRQIMIAMILFSVIACTLYAPWGIRNIIWTGNPVYPLYDNIIGQPYTPPCINAPDPEQSPNLSPLEYRRLIHDEDWLSIILIPARLFFQGRDNDSRYFDGKLSPLLFFLPLCCFCLGRLKRKDSIEAWGLFFFAWFYIAIALMTSVTRVRYLGPAVPPLVVLAIYGFYQMVQFAKKPDKKHVPKTGLRYLLLPGLVIFHMVVTVQYLIGQYQRYTPYHYISGRISKTDYIKRFRPENHCMDTINSRLGKKDKVLFLYMGRRGYYCDRDYIPDNGINLKLLYAVSREFATERKDVTERMIESGITHFLMNNRLAHEAILRDLNDREKEMFFQFISARTDKLCDSHGYSLYRLDFLRQQ